ncbi:hypothetical protein [Pseudobdellovibrio exovorus]|uniref:Uncharacterized protein n=1 Tax=Pseudobdellovibrio exovorus JSS TaxID=1184267 RepID=M4V9C2_9BACT|nr:hypothetical protein [Pseudobdellovibrio exovorus]AGH94626.1 hypothetical protein A11Q_406 [Pseudobdellovibrio exovorus JSS]
MQLKLRHLLLFVVACAVLILANFSGGALIGLAVALQLSLLIHGITLTKKAQWGALRLFAMSLPLILFWGAIHSLLLIYLKEKHIFLVLMAGSVVICLSAITNLQLVFSYYFLQTADFKVLPAWQMAFSHLKKNQREFLQITLILFIFSFIPLLSADWKIVFAITATHLYLNRTRLKTALAHL